MLALGSAWIYRASMETNALIDQQAFWGLIGEVRTCAGGDYQDIGTIYRDMSRLMVALLHTTDTPALVEIYKRLWDGDPNIRAMKACERAWADKNKRTKKPWPTPED